VLSEIEMQFQANEKMLLAVDIPGNGGVDIIMLNTFPLYSSALSKKKMIPFILDKPAPEQLQKEDCLQKNVG
jgi:hypothetical protein